MKDHVSLNPPFGIGSTGGHLLRIIHVRNVRVPRSFVVLRCVSLGCFKMENLLQQLMSYVFLLER